jgi:hypothetical protein
MSHNPDFEFINEYSFKLYFKIAYNAITYYDKWDWLRYFYPDPDKSYGFCRDETLKMIENKMYEDNFARGHSGYTFNYTMSQMKIISVIGYEKYKQEYIKNNTKNSS